MLLRLENDTLLNDFMSCFDHYWENLVERPPLLQTGSELLSADALLWLIQHGAVVAIAAVKELGPRDPVTHAERLTSQVQANSIPNLIEHTDDFMAKNAGGRIVPITLPLVDI